MWIWRRAFPGADAAFAVTLLGVLLVSHRNRADSLRDLGFRLDTLWPAALLLLPVAFVAIVSTLLVGLSMGSVRFPPADLAIPSASKAMAFGILQQYALLGFYYRAIAMLLPRPLAAMGLTALLFAAFHFPNPFLMAVTFVAGVIATAIYRRSPNIWLSGIVHGLISYCLYYSLPTELTVGLRVGPGYWTR